MFYLNVCLCKVCVPGAHRGQQRVSDPLDLGVRVGCELQCGWLKSHLSPLEEQRTLNC